MKGSERSPLTFGASCVPQGSSLLSGPGVDSYSLQSVPGPTGSTSRPLAFGLRVDSDSFSKAALPLNAMLGWTWKEGGARWNGMRSA